MAIVLCVRVFTTIQSGIILVYTFKYLRGLMTSKMNVVNLFFNNVNVSVCGSVHTGSFCRGQREETLAILILVATAQAGLVLLPHSLCLAKNR